MSRPSPKPHPLARGVVLLLAGGLLVGACGFAAWAALSTRASAAGATSASQLADAYQRARLAVARIELNEHAFRVQPDPAIVVREDRAQEDLRRAVASVVHHGDAHDRVVIHALDLQARELSPAFGRLVRAVRRGDAVAVDRIDRRQVAPVLRAMERTVNDAAADHRKELFAGLRSARRSETIVLAGMAVMLALCGLVVAAGTMLTRYRRALDSAAEAEIARLRGAAL